MAEASEHSLGMALAGLDEHGLSTASAADLCRRLDTEGQRLGLVPLRLCIHRSVTLEPLLDFVRVFAARRGQLVTVRLSGYAAPEVELMQDTALGEAGALVLAYDLCDLCPQAADPLGDAGWVNAAASRLVELARIARSRTTAPILVQVPTLLVSRLDGLGELLQPDRLGDRLAAFRRMCWEALAGIADCTLIDTELMLREVGLRHALDARAWQGFRVPWSTAGLRALAEQVARTLDVALRPRMKVLVLDCDNTIWGGVLGELGREGIKLAPDGAGAGYHALQRDALALARRGVLLALASKNDEAQVLDTLAHHPHALLRPSLLAAHRINWMDKASNIRSMAKELGLGLDSFVFVDDREAECELVRQMLPEVKVYCLPTQSHRLGGFLLSLAEFDVTRTLEADRARSAEYQARKQRSAARQDNVTDLDGYLRSLEVKVQIQAARGEALERVAQMEGKTNQFNTTTRRLKRTALEAIIAEGGEVLCASVADRFGDYGITLSVAMSFDATARVARIESFLGSCRVIGLGAELAVVSAACAWAKSHGASRIEAEVLFTERNEPARDVYQRAGFAKLSESPQGTQWSLDTTAECPWPAWIARV